MKRFVKNEMVLLIVTIALVVFAFLCGVHIERDVAKTKNENGVRFEYMERFGNIDSDGTLFIAEDGNLYAIDAQYPDAQGNAFLLKMDGHGTPEKTDDEILEVWCCPFAD